MHTYNDELQSPTSKMSISDAVLTSICFITPTRAVFNLLISLVVSSSSITTTSSPRLRRIQIDWGRGSARSISSTSSSSAVARGTIRGLRGRTAGPNMPCDASGALVAPGAPLALPPQTQARHRHLLCLPLKTQWFLSLPRASSSTRLLLEPIVRRCQVRQRRRLTLLPALLPPRVQPWAVRQSELAGSDPLYSLHCIRSAR